MIPVYVESNFLIEIATTQEQADAANGLLILAEQQELRLIMPDVVISESLSSLVHRGVERAVYFDRFAKPHLTQLMRAKRDQTSVLKLLETESILRNLQAGQVALLERTIDRVLSCGEIIRTDRTIFTDALNRRVMHDLETGDSIIVSAIMAHLNATPAGVSSYFVTRDADDFSALKADFTAKSCRFIASFDGALSAIHNELLKAH